MRREFADQLFKLMSDDEKIYFIIGDVGFGFFDKLKKTFPDRVINPGASEQLIVGMASGIAMDGFKPIIYSITPFILFRPFEFIRNLINHENLSVKIIGVGRDDDYGALGFTHYATDDNILTDSFENIKLFKPKSIEELNLERFLNHDGPAYLNLRR